MSSNQNKYQSNDVPPPGYPQEPQQAYGANTGYYGQDPRSQPGYYGSPAFQNGLPQPQQYPQGPYPQQGPYGQQGPYAQQQPMYYQQQQYPQQGGYYGNNGRGSAGEDCCAGMLGGLACCCCLELCLF